MRKTVSGKGVPTLVTSQTIDVVTSEPVGSVDENGTARTVTLDGFGRPILEQVSGGGVDGVLTRATWGSKVAMPRVVAWRSSNLPTL